MQMHALYCFITKGTMCVKGKYTHFVNKLLPQSAHVWSRVTRGRFGNQNLENI